MIHISDELCLKQYVGNVPIVNWPDSCRVALRQHILCQPNLYNVHLSSGMDVRIYFILPLKIMQLVNSEFSNSLAHNLLNLCLYLPLPFLFLQRHKHCYQQLTLYSKTLLFQTNRLRKLCSMQTYLTILKFFSVVVLKSCSANLVMIYRSSLIQTWFPSWMRGLLLHHISWFTRNITGLAELPLTVYFFNKWQNKRTDMSRRISYIQNKYMHTKMFLFHFRQKGIRSFHLQKDPRLP